jgi:hypothetical protein
VVPALAGGVAVAVGSGAVVALDGADGSAVVPVPAPAPAPGVLLGSGTDEPPGTVPEPPDRVGSGVRAGGAPDPSAEPPQEVPLPGSFLTTAASGLPATSSTTVTVPMASANTSPASRA